MLVNKKSYDYSSFEDNYFFSNSRRELKKELGLNVNSKREEIEKIVTKFLSNIDFQKLTLEKCSLPNLPNALSESVIATILNEFKFNIH